MLYYTIDKAQILDLVEDEVSHAADEAYSDDGTPLYDSIVITEKDRSTVKRFIDDGVSLLVKRLFDIAKYAPIVDLDTFGNPIPKGMRIAFYVPDYEPSMAEAIDREITRYLVLFSTTALFSTRRAMLVESYTARTQTAMDNAVTLLKSRKKPE